MGTEDRRHQRVANMSLKVALAPLLLCLVSGAPYNEAESAPQTKSVSCRTEYSVVWDTQYQEKEQTECVTNYEKVCHTVNERLCKATTRQECQTIYEQSCSTVYKSVCVEQFKTEYEPYTETECTTEYKEDCEFQWEGYGNNKIWAKIPGTTKHKKVPVRISKNIPKKVCDTGYTQQPVINIAKSNPNQNTNLVKNNKIVFADK